MNRYEGMFIFSDAVKADDVDDAVAKAREEIEKQGGEVESNTRLGKRSFARTLKKQEAGHYAVITFKLAADKIDTLKARYRLNEQVLRCQIIRLSGAEMAAAVEKSDG